MAPVYYEQTDISDSLTRLPAIDYQYRADAQARLNVLMPHYSQSLAFGGVVSALELSRHLAPRYKNVRFLSQHPLAETPDPVNFDAWAPGCDVEAADLYTDSLPCHQREIFFCTYWSTVKAWEVYARIQRTQNLQPNPFYYFIQDYEPGFYPYGHKHADCLQTYSHGPLTHAVFNSGELAAFFKRRGFSFQKEHVLLPSLHPFLAGYLEQNGRMLPPKPADKVVILLYGRPRQPRNCFPVIMEGLYRFFRDMPSRERTDYLVISAGAVDQHADIQLCPGVAVKAVGKLPLEKYAAYLGFAHVGLSFMASPHPSYPPLEMATFGLEVITNSFDGKDLSAQHPHIRSLDFPCPQLLAEALPGAVARARQRMGKEQRAVLPKNMSPLPWSENVAGLQLETLAPAG